MTFFIIILSGWVLVLLDTWYYEWKKAKRVSEGNDYINSVLNQNYDKEIL